MNSTANFATYGISESLYFFPSKRYCMMESTIWECNERKCLLHCHICSSSACPTGRLASRPDPHQRNGSYSCTSTIWLYRPFAFSIHIRKRTTNTLRKLFRNVCNASASISARSFRRSDKTVRYDANALYSDEHSKSCCTDPEVLEAILPTMNSKYHMPTSAPLEFAGKQECMKKQCRL